MMVCPESRPQASYTALAFHILRAISLSSLELSATELSRYLKVLNCSNGSALMDTLVGRDTSPKTFEGWYRHSVFLIFIWKLNCLAAEANLSTRAWIHPWVGDQSTIICEKQIAHQFRSGFCFQFEVSYIKEVCFFTCLDVNPLLDVLESYFNHGSHTQWKDVWRKHTPLLDSIACCKVTGYGTAHSDICLHACMESLDDTVINLSVRPNFTITC